METPGFLPAQSLPQPAHSMETQSQPEGSMLTCSPSMLRRPQGPREVLLLRGGRSANGMPAPGGCAWVWGCPGLLPVRLEGRGCPLGTDP